MSITQLPSPPLRSSPIDFAERADAFMAAIPTFAVEANALAAEVETNATNTVNSVNLAMAAGLADAAANAASASSSASSAATSASSAQSAWTAALAANPDLDPAVRMNPSTITTDTTIPAGYNAYSAGPVLTIGTGKTVTINDNANWSII